MKVGPGHGNDVPVRVTHTVMVSDIIMGLIMVTDSVGPDDSVLW